MNRIVAIFGILSLTVFSCCGQKKKNVDTVVNTFEINKERKIFYDEDSSLYYLRTKEQIFRNMERLLKLPLINNGKHELYLRIWVWDFDKNYIINICKDSVAYKCHIFEFATIYEDSTHSYVNILREWQNIKPISGWDVVFNKIEEYKIPFLENGKIHLQKRGSLTQSTYIQFEIVQNNKYRWYEYLEPSYYRYVDINSKAVYDFLKYLNKEMNVEMYKASETLYLKLN